MEGDDLVGSAEWSIRKSVAGPEHVSLGPLSLAIRRAHWIDKHPAVITSKPGTSSELLVERSDDSQLQFDWSARSVREPAGLRIPIRTPASPIAVMTLELPADLQPRLNAEQAIISGPTSDNGRFVWNIAFGGSDFLDLHLVSRAASKALPTMISRQRNRHTIAVGQISSEFTVELESFHREIRELKFHCEPGFQPTEVTARNLADWHFESSGELTLNWREPFGGGEIGIRGIGSLPKNSDWLIPGLKVLGAAPMGETLTLQSAPDIALSDCQPGSFRIVESVAPPDRAGSIVVLQRGIFQSADTRPIVRISLADAAFRTHESIWWRLDGVDESLIAQVSIESLRGAISQSRWRIPRNFTVERVDAGPPDALSSWQVVDDILSIDWQRTLTAGRTGRLTIQLACPKHEPSGATDSIAVPDLVPLGSSPRTGRVAIKTPPNVRAIAESASVTPPPADDRESSPWGLAEPDLILPLVPGRRIQLLPRPSGFECQAICRISPMQDLAAVTYRLHIEPHETPISNLLLRCPHGCDLPGDWRVVQGRATIRSVDRIGWQTELLAWTATHSIWSALAPIAAHDDWSRISFSGPVAEPFDLEFRTMLPPLRIPLFEMVGSLASSWQTTIDSASGSQWDVRSASGRPLWRMSDSSGHRSFRSEPDVLTVSLRPNSGPVLDDMRLTVDASQPGRLSFALSFGVSDYQRGDLPLTLPAGARSVAIVINGMTAAVEPFGMADDRLQVNLPARSADRWTAELRYTTPTEKMQFWDHLSARLPTADFSLPPPRTTWVLPAGWVPGRPTSFVQAAPSANSNDSIEGPSRWMSADTAAVPFIEIIRPSEIQRFCLAIAIVIACCGLAADRNAARIGVVVGSLIAFAVIWLPAPWHQFCWAPLVACAVLILCPHLAEMARGRISIVGRPKTGPVTAFGFLALAVWTATTGAAAARSGAPISSDAIPIQAEYAGVVKGSTVEFTAHIAAFVSGDEPTSLNLPWAGLQLQTATLDGQSVTASIANHEAKIPVTGRGRHEFTVTFTADCRGQDDGQIDFPIAEVCDCTLSLRAPKSALNLDALTRQGAARVTSELGFERLDADLGRVDRIRVGWNRVATAVATIRSDEAYLWILEEQSARLIGDVQVEIIGAAEKLQLVIPNRTTVKSISARFTERGGPDQSPRLRDWNLENQVNFNRLTLEFSRPISGRWQIELELVPTAPLSPDFTLEFPQVQSTTRQSACAWRASGVDLEEVHHGDLSPITPGEYRAGHSALPPSDSDRAYRRTAGAQSSGVRLRLRPDRPAIPPHSDVAPAQTLAGQEGHPAPRANRLNRIRNFD